MKKFYSLSEGLKRNNISPGLFGCSHVGFASSVTQCRANLCLKVFHFSKIRRDGISSLTHTHTTHPLLQSENRQISASVGQNRSLCGADFKLMETNLC